MSKPKKRDRPVSSEIEKLEAEWRSGAAETSAAAVRLVRFLSNSLGERERDLQHSRS